MTEMDVMPFGLEAQVNTTIDDDMISWWSQRYRMYGLATNPENE